MTRQRGKKALGIAAALSLAVTMTACHGGTYDEAGGEPTPEPAPVSGEFTGELSALQQLMEAQDASYTYDCEGVYTTGEGDDAIENVIDYTMQVEGGSVLKSLETYSEEDDFFTSSQIYVQGGQVIQVTAEGDAIDMTQALEPSEPVPSREDLFVALMANATNVQVVEEGDEVVYTIEASGVDMGPINMVDDATDIAGTYRFDGDGVLLGITATIEGTFGEGADAVFVSEDVAVTFSGWGETQVPFAPPCIGTYEVGDVAALAGELSDVFEKMPKNLTCVMETATTVFQGDLSLTQDMHLEAYQDATDGLRALIYLEAPDSGIDEMYTYVADGRVTASVDGEVVSADYNYETEDPTGLGRATGLLSCAEALDSIAYNNGEVEYILYADPQKVTDEVDLDGWDLTTLCEAHYYLNTAGELTAMTMYVEGFPEKAETADYMTVDIQAWYSDFNTTEVLNPFE